MQFQICFSNIVLGTCKTRMSRNKLILLKHYVILVEPFINLSVFQKKKVKVLCQHNVCVVSSIVVVYMQKILLLQTRVNNFQCSCFYFAAYLFMLLPLEVTGIVLF